MSWTRRNILLVSAFRHIQVWHRGYFVRGKWKSTVEWPENKSHLNVLCQKAERGGVERCSVIYMSVCRGRFLCTGNISHFSHRSFKNKARDLLVNTGLQLIWGPALVTACVLSLYNKSEMQLDWTVSVVFFVDCLPRWYTVKAWDVSAKDFFHNEKRKEHWSKANVSTVVTVKQSLIIPRGTREMTHVQDQINQDWLRNGHMDINNVRMSVFPLLGSLNAAATVHWLWTHLSVPLSQSDSSSSAVGIAVPFLLLALIRWECCGYPCVHRLSKVDCRAFVSEDYRGHIVGLFKS